MEDQVDIQQIQPPTFAKGPAGWLRENLFSPWYNGILTCIALLFLYFVFKGFLTWAFTEAEWNVIPANLQLFAIGAYPRDQVYRIWICLYILTGLLGLSAGAWRGIVQRWTIIVGSILLVFLVIPFEIVQRQDSHLVSIEFRFNLIWLIFESRRWLLGDIALLIGAFFLGKRFSKLRPWISGGWLLSFPIIMFILHGFGENVVPTGLWSGLLLTLIFAVVGITVSFPLGVFLALCRQSKLPAIKWVSIFYIEIVRGMPLLMVLFMGSRLINIFIPYFDINQVIAMMICLTLFSGAYMAENIRGGLQSIPNGQREAAQAVGLNYVQSNLFIVLPQALRAVIPAIVGQFIALFKDTTLVALVGPIELFGVAKSAFANPDWLGHHVEVLLFIALSFFIFCFAMSKISQEIETELGVGKH